MKFNSFMKNVEKKKSDDFLPTLNSIFRNARFIGIAGYGLTISLSFTLILFLMLLALETCAIWKIIKLVTGLSTNVPGGIIARLSGSIFYLNALISLLLSSKFVHSWQSIYTFWLNTECAAGLNFTPDIRIRKRTIFVTCMVVTFALVEYLLSMMSATDFNFPPEEYFERYILNSHGFVLQDYEYSEWFALPLGVISSVATLLWNFPDLLIVLISVGLASRYRRLNLCLARVCALDKKKLESNKKVETVKLYTWRKLREAYVKQAKLVRRMDEALGGIILLSCFCNFYFICLQLFLGITVGTTVPTLKRSYYFISLAWLCIRVTSVVLAASDINLQSQAGLKNIYNYDTNGYNVEVERLQDQLTKDYIALSGMGFFYLNKNILLQMAGAIITYELVLIQFDNKGSDTEGLQLNMTRL